MTELPVIASMQSFSKSPRMVTARQRQIIELAALGTPLEQIAKVMGSIRIDSVRRLLDRALAAQAETLREDGAWERAYVLQTTRLDMLMATWMPKALAGDDKAATMVDKWLTHYERLQGLAAPQRLEAAVTVDDASAGRASVIEAVLARLDDVKMRQQIIDGQAVETTAEETS
jgi:hypothetical protein